MKNKEEEKFYTIKLDCLVPTTLTFKILAKDENDAIEKIKSKQPSSYKPDFSKKRNIKAVVYEFGNLIIKLTKNYF